MTSRTHAETFSSGGPSWYDRLGVKLTYALGVWMNIAAGRFLTSEDGLPAFWKLAYITNIAIYIRVVQYCHEEQAMATCIGWLFAWAVLSTFAGHSLKGLQLYGEYKLANNFGAHVQSNVNVNMADVVRELRKKEPNMYTDDER